MKSPVAEPGARRSGMSDQDRTLLSVRDLNVTFRAKSLVRAVRGVSYDLGVGEQVGLVGESGSGKSAGALALVRLLPDYADVSGDVTLEGADLMGLTERGLRAVRGDRVGIVYQDPFSSLNPVITIGKQVTEVLRKHKGLGMRAARHEAARLLETVGVPNSEDRISDYPHQFSGGMRQRAVIAMAVAPRPALLIADEPTTALDVTVQAQILELLQNLTSEHGTTMLLITHDLGVVAGVTQRVMVMYAGRIVEASSTKDVFTRASHPYTVALHKSLPRIDVRQERLVTIDGQPPDPTRSVEGCPFAPRCPSVIDRCATEDPPLMTIPTARRATARGWDMASIRAVDGIQVPGPASPHLTACWNPPEPAGDKAERGSAP
ncbi:MAG: ABC transporter ATP-binding protein [bacterium]|nr:ABC transporter ATP-binding protein [bacterium]